MLNTIQIFTLIAAIIVVAALLRSYRRHLLSGRRFFAWVLLWIVILTVALEPHLSDRVASFFGVARGTDAAFFVAILLIFYILFRLFIRIENIERNITTIVREIALRNGNRSDKVE